MRKETYKIKCPKHIVFGDPLYFEEYKGERLKKLVVDYEVPAKFDTARLVLEALGKQPLITADMHLGEGTGAVASIPLWDMALAVYQNCYSFAEGGIEPYTPQC